ncbi:RNA polymerase sigma factor SigJ [Undibacterium parvum]|uniref:Sigma-70 family RNA polymerase sigma factor n=1 Tax=Undibacterium parvum TaxID=401471 RepID=A0A3Q9BQ25_9BURK|nr:sigma-70 family RNA polymerase sigma factor [Undibacterium parvum]
MTTRLAVFTGNTARLYGIAYRMLGSRAEADDILQIAYLRWHALSIEQIDQLQSPQAWLVTVVSRLCIDRLRSLKVEREAYIGPWLAEPLIELELRTPELLAEFSDEVSLAFMHLLERLSVEERAAYLLHQIFEVEYVELANLLGKTQASCRQLLHRAKQRLAQAQTRFSVSREQHTRLLQEFSEAASSGNYLALKALFNEQASLTGDSGGKVVSVNRVLHGAARIARLYHVVARRFGARMHFEMARINGEVGLLRYLDGQLDAVICIATDGEKILHLYTVRNPDKLQTS